MPRKYSGLLRTLCNPSIFRTLVYSKPWQIQNQRHMQNSGIFRTEVYSEPWGTQNPRQIQNSVKHLRWSIVQKLLTATAVFANYNYFWNISFLHSLLFFKFNKGLFLAPKVFILCKKAQWPRGPGAMNFDISTLCHLVSID